MSLWRADDLERTISSGADGPALQKVVTRGIKLKLQGEGAHCQQPQRLKNNYIFDLQPC